MEYELPSGGCSVFYGTYIDHYLNNVRTRYYLHEGKLIQSSRQTYNYNYDLSSYHCLTNNDLPLYYNSETLVYFPFLALIVCLLAFSLIYKVIIKRLLP